MLFPYTELIFFIKERGLWLVSIPDFLRSFWRKMFLTLCFTNWLSFMVQLGHAFNCWNIEQYVVICIPVYDVVNFETILSFLIKPLLCMTKEVSKNFNNLKMKIALKLKQKAFFIIFKWLLLKQIKPNFL